MSPKNNLIGLIILFAITAMIFESMGFHLPYFFLKPATSIFVLLVAFLYGVKENKAYHKLTLLGLACCILGDSLLLNDAYFIGGLLAFLTAHILFTIAFIRLGGFYRNLIPLVILVMYGLGILFYIYDGLGALTIPVICYLIVILTMAWQGINLFIKNPSKSHQFIAIGVMFFIVSDSLLAINKFQTAIPLASIWILSTYWIAITCLALASTIKKPQSALITE